MFRIVNKSSLAEQHIYLLCNFLTIVKQSFFLILKYDTNDDWKEFD